MGVNTGPSTSKTGVMSDTLGSSVPQNKEAVRALSAHQSLMKLLHGAADARTLARLAIPMTETDFLSMCEERALAGKCGNPMCSTRHSYQAPAETPRINWQTLEMVTVAVDQHWCSKECHTKCAQFARSLGSAMDRLAVLARLGAVSAPPQPSIISHGRAKQQLANGKQAGRKAKVLGVVRERLGPSTTLVEDTPAGSQSKQPPLDTEPAEQHARCTDPAGSQPGADAHTRTWKLLDAEAAEGKQLCGEAETGRPGGTSSEELPGQRKPACKSSTGAGESRKHASKPRRKSKAAALLQELRRSVEQQEKELPLADDFDFEDSDDEAATSPADVMAAPDHVADAARDGYVRSMPPATARQTGSDTADLHKSHVHAGGDLRAVIHTESEEGRGRQQPSCTTAVSEVDHSTPPSSSTDRKPYTNVKGKFKPVRTLPQACPVEAEVISSDPSQCAASATTAATSAPERADGTAIPKEGAGADTDGSEAVATPRSGSVGSRRTSESSSVAETAPRPTSTGSKKRVLFGTCQMYAYDPDDPPAGGDSDCVCEVPLPPASPPPTSPRCTASGPITVLTPSTSNVLSSAATVETEGEAVGSSRPALATQKPCIDAKGTNEAGLVADHDKAPPVKEDSDMVRPVLYFDVELGATEAEMQGALRVTTTQALHLTDEDLDELHKELHERREAAVAADPLHVQEEEDREQSGHDAEQGNDLEDGEADGARMARQRRPRLRSRGRSPAPPADRTLPPEQLHAMKRQAAADMFRYYLAPEAGGVGVAGNVGELHNVATDLARRSSRAAELHAARGRGVAGAGARDTIAQASTSSGRAASHDADGLSEGEQHSSESYSGGSCEQHASSEEGFSEDGDGGSEEDAASVSDGDAGDSAGVFEPAGGGGMPGTEGQEVSQIDTEAAGGTGSGAGSVQTVEGFYDSNPEARPRLSLFGVCWRLLNRWVCPATVVHLHGRNAQEAPTAFPEAAVLAQRALRIMLLGRVAPLLARLQIEVPKTMVESEMHDLIDTLDTSTAVPSLSSDLKDCLALVLLGALSKQRVTSVARAFKKDYSALQDVLAALGMSSDLYTCLLGCLLDQ